MNAQEKYDALVEEFAQTRARFVLSSRNVIRCHRDLTEANKEMSELMDDLDRLERECDDAEAATYEPAS